MIIPGICSLTLKTLPPEALIRFAADSGLRAIEWWAAGHVPPGEVALAERVGEATRRASLQVSTYGSYYRAGVSEQAGMPFASVLDSAIALGAPSIRVWAGDKNPDQATDEDWTRVVADTLRIADLAAARGLAITFEFHGGTLTHTHTSARRLAGLIPHPGVHFSWQPPHGYDADHCAASLASLLDRLNTLHVFHWTLGAREKSLCNEGQRPPGENNPLHRHPLSTGADRWTTYLDIARRTGRDHFALLEFTEGDTPEQARADAATLVELCARQRTRC